MQRPYASHDTTMTDELPSCNFIPRRDKICTVDRHVYVNVRCATMHILREIGPEWGTRFVPSYFKPCCSVNPTKGERVGTASNS